MCTLGQVQMGVFVPHSGFGLVSGPFLFCQGHVSQSVECTQECLTVDTILLLRAMSSPLVVFFLYTNELWSAGLVENQAGAGCLPN